MEPERVDLSILDPQADAAAWERLVAAVMGAAAPEIARRAARRTVFGAVAEWAWPALAAGIVLAAASAAALTLGGRQVAGLEAPRAGVEEALRLAEPVSLWLMEDRVPTTADLILALEEEIP